MNPLTKQIRADTLKLQESANRFYLLYIKGTCKKSDVILKLKSIYYDADTLPFNTVASKKYVLETKGHISDLINKLELNEGGN